jgi:hypothetical protein
LLWGYVHLVMNIGFLLCRMCVKLSFRLSECRYFYLAALPWLSCSHFGQKDIPSHLPCYQWLRNTNEFWFRWTETWLRKEMESMKERKVRSPCLSWQSTIFYILLIASHLAYLCHQFNWDFVILELNTISSVSKS